MLYCERLYWNRVTEIREKMEFEAEVLRENGVDFVHYPRFLEAAKRISFVVATRQAIDATKKGVLGSPDETLQFLTIMIGKDFEREILLHMNTVGDNTIDSKIGRSFCLAFAAVLLLAPPEFDKGFFQLMTGVFFALFLRSAILVHGKVRALPKVEKVMVRFYKELETVVQSEGSEGFLSVSENVEKIIAEIEEGLRLAEEGELDPEIYGSDFDTISGFKLFSAFGNPQILDAVLRKESTIAARTDSTPQSLQSDSDSP